MESSSIVSTLVSVDCPCWYHPEISDRQIRHLFTKSLELTFRPTDDGEEDVVVKAASRREGTKTLRRRRSLLVSGTDRRKREIVQREPSRGGPCCKRLLRTIENLSSMYVIFHFHYFLPSLLPSLLPDQKEQLISCDLE